MQAPEILCPPLAKMLGKWCLDFLHQPSTCNPRLATRLHKLREMVQIEIISSEVRERVDAQDSIEELSGERHRPRVRMDRKHAVFNARITNAPQVLRSAEPEICRPNL